MPNQLSASCITIIAATFRQRFKAEASSKTIVTFGTRQPIGQSLGLMEHSRSAVIPEVPESEESTREENQPQRATFATPARIDSLWRVLSSLKASCNHVRYSSDQPHLLRLCEMQ